MGAAERRKGRRWAIGCGAALGLALLAALVLAGRVWYAQRASDPRADRRVTEVVAGADLAGSAGAARGEPVRILLEMDVGETFVEPAEPGEPLTVEADYDANLYRLEEPRDDPGWDRRVRFRLTGSRVVAGLKEAVYGGQPQVRVRLPRDVPLELKLVQRNGGAFVDVGGLDLRDFQVEFDGAIVKIGADEPLTGDLRRFALRGGKAGAFVDGLSRMRPREVDVDFRMGEAQLDFRGDWDRETRVDLQAHVADLVLRLPRGVPVSGLDGDAASPASPAPAPDVDAEAGAPATGLRFDVRRGRRVTVRKLE